MKYLLLFMVATMMSLPSTAQENEEEDFLNIRGRMLNMTQKYTKVLIIKGYGEVDTISTVHLNKRNGKFELPPLEIHKDYTIVFIHGERVKTLYIVSAGSDALSDYFVRLLLDFNFGDPTNDVIGSVEYNSKRDKYNMYETSALKTK